MAVSFGYVTHKAIYSWIGYRKINPAYDSLYDPFITFGADPSTNNFSGYKYLPTNIDSAILEYKEFYIQEVNGNPNLNDPVAELAGKTWNKTVEDSIVADPVKVRLVDNQWSHVINTTNFNETVHLAYVGDMAPSGRAYIGAGDNSNDNVILLNASFADFDTTDLSLGTWGGWLLMHELGHVYGLFHGGETADLNQNPDLLKMSIMWYPEQGEYAAAKIPLTPGMEDIKDLQIAYGLSDAQDGNTSYTFTQNNVDLGHGTILDGVAGADLNNYVMTLSDRQGNAGGNDTIDASALDTNTYIDLRDGHFSAIGTDIALTQAQKGSGVSYTDQQTAEQFAQTVNKLKGKVTILFITHQLPKGLQVDEKIVLGKAAVKESVET